MYCMSGNGKFFLDWILANVDIISFLLHPLSGVNNQQSLYELLSLLILNIWFGNIILYTNSLNHSNAGYNAYTWYLVSLCMYI